MSEKERNIEYRGRIKIYTDVKEITKDNVIQVLSTAMTKHELNRTQIRNLINFEKGDQPLMREKKVRKDIDIKSISNLAHQITEFWLGYFWGNHMAFVQKSDKHPKGSNPTDNDSAITLLNEMYDAEDMESKDQLLAYYLEVCGTCCQLIDIKRKPDDEDAVFDLEEQLQQMRIEYAKLKKAQEDAAADASNWKKKYNATLSDAEKLAQEKADKEAEKDAELAQLRKESAVSKYEKNFLTLGYSQELAQKAAEAQFDGDTDTLFLVQSQAQEAILKAKESEWYKNRPEVNTGVSSGKEDPFLQGFNS